MELLLKVARYKGEPPGREMTCTFGPDGGIIGRKPGADWVLEDPQTFLSGRHARISLEGDGFVITDTSLNGTFINKLDAPVGKGRSHPLIDGDRIFMGEYEISVHVTETVPAGEPPASPMETKPAEEPAASPFAPPPAEQEAGPALDDDWFNQPAEADDGAGFFAEVEEPPATSTPKPPSQKPQDEFFEPPAVESGAAEQIPDDWDALLSGIGELSPPAEAEAPPQTTGDAKAPARRSQPTARPSTANAEPAGAPGPAARRPRRASAPGDGPWAVLLESLGLGGRAQGRDPEELAREVGESLRTVSEGLMAVLAARAEMKDEFRLSQTMIRPAKNNPLKFSPNVEEALRRMFTQDEVGFLQAPEAYDRALDDVKAHQVAMLAGIQAGLTSVLAYFSPDNLEKEISQHAALAGKLPGVREAKLWGLFTNLYQKIADDAQSDFHRLFSREFAKAYERQIGVMSSAHQSVKERNPG